MTRIDIRLPVLDQSGQRMLEEVLPAEPLGRGRYRLLASPGLVEGVAAGDELELSPAEPPGTGSSGEGGQLCVWVYIPDPPPHHTDARLTQAAAALGGYLDGGNTRLRVLTVPVSAGFAVSRRSWSRQSGSWATQAGLTATSTIVRTVRSGGGKSGPETLQHGGQSEAGQLGRVSRCISNTRSHPRTSMPFSGGGSSPLRAAGAPGVTSTSAGFWQWCYSPSCLPSALTAS
jgi:Domain of unknown function (DUF4265)